MTAEDSAAESVCVDYRNSLDSVPFI